MKKASILTLFFCTLLSLTVFSQTKNVQGTLASRDSAQLTILSTFPDSFPTISVIFKAETHAGEPVWNLTKEKMIVKEDELDCQVLSLAQISNANSLNIGIVIDHSGSMAQQTYTDSYWQKHWQDIKAHPEKYPSPLELGKRAVNNFVRSFNAEKDEIAVIGFSSGVAPVLPLTNDLEQIRKIVKEMEPDGGTALYDGMIRGLDEVKSGSGIPVLIALTDGQDGGSYHTWERVVEKAKNLDVPVYVVGLGDVDDKILKKIARQTNGDYYYTKSAKALNEIYAKISRRVQAYYELVYTSPNLSAESEIRDVEIRFETDSLLLETHSRQYPIPAELVKRMEQLKADELAARKKEYVLYGGIIMLAVVASGVILLSRRRKKTENLLMIASISPNPSPGTVKVRHNAQSGILQVLDANGNLVLSTSVAGAEQYLDLSSLNSGTYLILVQEDGKVSVPVKLILQK